MERWRLAILSVRTRPLSPIKIYLLEAGLPRPAALSGLANALSGEDKARLAGLARAEDCWRFALSRALLLKALRERHGIDAPEFVTGEFGKPALAGAGPRFNLAHSGGLIACALAADFDIGVDVEKSAPVPERAAIARDQFTPREQALLAAAAPGGGDAVFLRIWTLKEAVVKALGQGLSHPLDTFEICLAPPGLLSAGGHMHPLNQWRLAQWLLPAGSHLALAARGAGAANVLIEIVEVALEDLLAQEGN